MRCAIYARFSTDRQSATSADDQVRACRERADREGWEVGAVFTDLAISGATDRRPGMTAMLQAAAAGSFDIVLSEALDRISRNQADIAGIYQRLEFSGARLVTLTEGEVNELHIGLKGTMGALFLRDLGEKIRRGAKGAISRGRVPGGLCYGYTAVPTLRTDGTLERGIRRIDPAQADIVRRIYAEYVGGAGPKLIAHGLNRDGIVSARGGEWRPSAIVGSASRQIGVLRNPIYVGRFVYGRVRMVRDPDSRNRVSRLNGPADRTIQAMSELAIVDQATWDAAQALLASRSGPGATLNRPPKHLLSGLVRCGLCGGAYTRRGGGRWACARHVAAGTCDNARTLKGDELRERVLTGLEQKMLAPEAIQRMLARYHVTRARKARALGRSRESIERRIAAADRAIARLIAAIAEGDADFPELRDALHAQRHARDVARRDLNEIETIPVIALHPQIVDSYRQRIRALLRDLTAESSQAQAIGAQIRSLIEAVIVTPRAEKGSDIDVVGLLGAVLGLASEGQLQRPFAMERGTQRQPNLSAALVAEDRYLAERQFRLFKA